MIYDFENRPISNYMLTLGKNDTTITDINGRFLFQKIKAGRYGITGHKAGYETYEGEIIISDKRQIIYLRIPSSGQLLDLADNALTRNQIDEAYEYTQRAYRIGEITTELLFYMAVISFRRGIYTDAIYFLQAAIHSGSTDEYVYRFLEELMGRSQNEK
jgi:hypothetical protein